MYGNAVFHAVDRQDYIRVALREAAGAERVGVERIRIIRIVHYRRTAAAAWAVIRIVIRRVAVAIMGVAAEARHRHPGCGAHAFGRIKDGSSVLITTLGTPPPASARGTKWPPT